MRARFVPAICLALACVMAARTVFADQPGAPPPPAYPPQPYPAPAPPTYAPPPPYAYQPMLYNNGPRYMRYEEGQPIPPGYQLEQRMYGGMVIPGAVLFGVFYSIGALIAASSDPPRDANWLVLPVAGPWIMLSSTSDGVGRFFLISDGLVQAASVALLVFGIRGRQVLVRTDLASLTVTPMLVAGGSGSGAMLTARF